MTSKTPLRAAFVQGSGAVLDCVASTSVSDTRVHGIQATGVGTFIITGTSVDNYGTKTGNNIVFALTTTSDSTFMTLLDLGLRMTGTVKVSAPTSAATVTVFYG